MDHEGRLFSLPSAMVTGTGAAARYPGGAAARYPRDPQPCAPRKGCTIILRSRGGSTLAPARRGRRAAVRYLVRTPSIPGRLRSGSRFILGPWRGRRAAVRYLVRTPCFWATQGDSKSAPAARTRQKKKTISPGGGSGLPYATWSALPRAIFLEGAPGCRTLPGPHSFFQAQACHLWVWGHSGLHSGWVPPG